MGKKEFLEKVRKVGDSYLTAMCEELGPTDAQDFIKKLTNSAATQTRAANRQSSTLFAGDGFDMNPDAMRRHAETTIMLSEKVVRLVQAKKL